MSEKSNHKIILSLDLARGLAAILVMLSHLRAYMFVTYSENHNNNLFSKLFYFFTGLGHEAVMIFFVLSGFLISKSIFLKTKQEDDFKWSDYLLNRIIRLNIVYIPALLLTLFWDKLGLLLTDSIYYKGLMNNLYHVGPKEPVNLTIESFIGSLFFLQTILTPIFGTNGVVWSLANEFWYYIIFPIVYLYFISFKRFKKLFLLFLIFLWIYIFPVELVKYFFVWLLGVFCFILKEKFKNLIYYLNKFHFKFLSLLLLLSTVIVSSYLRKMSFEMDFLIGISYSLIILVYYNFTLKSNILRKIISFFAKISYTLYLVHVPVIVFIFCYFFANKRFFLTTSTFFFFIILIILLLIYSYLVYYLFERQTFKVRKLITKIKHENFS